MRHWIGLDGELKNKRERISHHRFADDIVIVVESLEQLGEMLHSLNGASRCIGLSMNLDKTKIMFNENVSLDRSTSKG